MPKFQKQGQQEIESLTPGTYKVKDGEEGYFHVMVHLKQFDPKTGKPTTKARISKYDPKEWSIVQPELKKQGYELTILHDPTEVKEGK